MRTAPPPSSPTPPSAPAASVITVDVATLEGILHHAAFAAHLVGHLDDDAHRELIRQIGEQVDTIAHELTELLGAPSALAEPDAAEPDAAAPDDRATRDGAPMLISAPSGRGRQKVDHTIQVSEGDPQILRRLSEDGLGCSPLDGQRETRRLGETGGP
jgi:hypothetical protein